MNHPEFARSAVLRAFGEPLAVEEVQVPRTLEPGALLVRIEVCSICGTDVHLAHGNLAIKVNLPIILGHEMVGRVIAIGDGAHADSLGQPLKTGDRVVWSHAYCGNCFHCTLARQPFLCANKRMYMYESMEKPPYLMVGSPNTATCCRARAACACPMTCPTNSRASRVARSVRSSTRSSRSAASGRRTPS